MDLNMRRQMEAKAKNEQALARAKANESKLKEERRQLIADKYKVSQLKARMKKHLRR